MRLLFDDGNVQIPIEVKSGQTLVPHFFGSLKKWRILSGHPERPAALVYGGDMRWEQEGISIIPWRDLANWIACLL